MRKQFNQRQKKINKRWMMRAIATPVFFWPIFFWPILLLIAWRLWVLIGGLRTIAAVAGGLFLVLKFRIANKNQLEIADLSGTDLSGRDLSGADLIRANLMSANLNGANLSGANLSGANLSGADLISANLNGANLSRAELRYANLSGANLRYTNLSGASLKSANLSRADLNCTILRAADFSEANLSSALLFFTNLREALNLEPLQLEAEPAPFLCNVALPAYAKQPEVNPNRACGYIPQLLSDRYHIPLEEAQEILYEALQHKWE